MHVVATAGHVDHGKTTLLRRLTGQEPDRWVEERRRGLTIDLGFVWTEFDGLGAVAFVDVPGHEKFLANMLAGAGPVRRVLFVVAADDGWSAQSQEHLEILDLLDARGVVAVVTKADQVSSDRADQVTHDVRDRLAPTSLTGTPVVVADSVTGRGLDDVIDTLRARLAEAPKAADEPGTARLWVDRSFTIKGAGTVVTGTLEGGHLSIGQPVAVLPDDRRGRIRGLQCLGQPVEHALAGWRVAVNLAGISHDDIRRGHALVAVDGGRPQTLTTRHLDVTVRALPGRTIDRTGAWLVHTGSAMISARVHPLLGPVTPDTTGHARLDLDDPLPLRSGDRLVLREAGQNVTAGGGTVLDPDPPPRPRGTQHRLERAETLDRIHHTSTRPQLVQALVVAAGGARDRYRTAAAIGGLPDDLTDLRTVGDHLVTDNAFQRWCGRMVDAAQVVPPGTSIGPGDAISAATTAGCPADVAASLLEQLATSGTLVRHDGRYLHPDHEPAFLTARQSRQQQLLDALNHQPLQPPDPDELAAQTGTTPHEIDELVRTGKIVRCGSLLFTRDAINHAITLLRTTNTAHTGVTASAARQLWNTNRHCTILLLEHLQQRRITQYDGHHHTLLPNPNHDPSQ